MCRDRLALHGPDQPINMQIAPNLAEIWSRSANVSGVLSNNVDAVIAQASFLNEQLLR